MSRSSAWLLDATVLDPVLLAERSLLPPLAPACASCSCVSHDTFRPRLHHLRALLRQEQHHRRDLVRIRPQTQPLSRRQAPPLLRRRQQGIEPSNERTTQAHFSITIAHTGCTASTGGTDRSGHSIFCVSLECFRARLRRTHIPTPRVPSYGVLDHPIQASALAPWARCDW